MNMDWAEELKMSIRKTTARKGRRSKSRDALEDDNQQASTGAATTAKLTTPTNKEISIDITLDLQNSSSRDSASTTTAQSSKNAFQEDNRRPTGLRRISGGWADTGGFKSSKSKKGSFDDERFQFLHSATSSPTIDDIPIIPDMDDIKDDLLFSEIVQPQNFKLSHFDTLKELDSDLLSQAAFNIIEDADLSILTRCLQPQTTLDEPDEVWEWNKLFTDVIAEINSEKSRVVQATQQLEIGPDELPPMMPNV